MYSSMRFAFGAAWFGSESDVVTKAFKVLKFLAVCAVATFRIGVADRAASA